MLFYLKQVKSIHLVFSCSLVSLLEFTRKLNEDGFKMSLPIAPERQWSPPPPVQHQDRSEYAGDIFDDSSRICPLTADNSSTETMSSIPEGG